MSDRRPGEREFRITTYSKQAQSATDDPVAIEEPMEIRVVHGPGDQRAMKNVSITMRTPGNDEELAAGFLFNESILTAADQIESIQTRGVTEDGEATGNIIRIDLREDAEFDGARLRRNFLTNSSCGVCGKASLDSLAIHAAEPFPADGLRIHESVIYGLPDKLRSSQPTFDATGGLHAAALFDADGQLIAAREDIGRHNAVDKLIGRMFLDGLLPLHGDIMMVSGRVSFEIMQKALAAGVPAVVAVGAPSSLAIDVAREYGMTLLGFASDQRFNVYASDERIQAANRSR